MEDEGNASVALMLQRATQPYTRWSTGFTHILKTSLYLLKIVQGLQDQQDRWRMKVMHLKAVKIVALILQRARQPYFPNVTNPHCHTCTEDQQDRWRMKVMCNSTRAEDQQDRWRMKVVCGSTRAEDQQDRWRMKAMCSSKRAEDQQDRWRMKVMRMKVVVSHRRWGWVVAWV